MPWALRPPSRYSFIGALIALISCAVGTAGAEEEFASLNASVAAGRSHVTRLRNLPRGVFLSISVTIDGEAAVLLLDEQNRRRARETRKPLFSGATSDSLEFGVRIPESGTYYLLIDNGAGSVARHFSVAITASTESSVNDSADGDRTSNVTALISERGQYGQRAEMLARVGDVQESTVCAPRTTWSEGGSPTA